MIKFKELTVKNFMSISELTWDFKVATSLCLGKNMDSASADDNGSGKSAIADAFRWVLFGESTRQAIDKSLAIDCVVREGQQEAKVILGFTRDDFDGVVVERSRKKSSGALKVTLNGVTHEKKAAQEVLDNLLGIDAVQFSNLVHLDSSYPRLFTRSTDRDRKDILADLVDVSYLYNIQEKVKQELARVEIKKTAAQRTIELTLNANELNKITLKDTRAQGKETTECLKEAKTKLLGAQKDLKDRDKVCKDAKDAVVRAESGKDSAYKRVESELRAVKIAITQKEADIQDLAERYAACDTQGLKDIQEPKIKLALILQKHQEMLELTKKGTCPTCNQQTTSEGFQTQLDSMEEEYSQTETEISCMEDILKQRLAVWQRQINQLEDNLYELEQIEQKFEDERAAIDVKFNKIGGLKKMVDVASKNLSKQFLVEGKLATDIKHYKERVKKLKEQVAEIKASIEDNKEKVRVSTEYLIELTTEVEDLNFWNKGFGPKGVPSLYIEMILPKISAGIQKYADILTDGDIQVELRAYKETKSGSPREAIQIIATNSYGASVYGSNSKGERCRIDLAVTLGLMDYFKLNRVFECNTLICDEIFDGLDSRGVELAVKALEKAAIPSVLVMSHNEGFKSYFNNVIVVKKEDGVSTLEA